MFDKATDDALAALHYDSLALLEEILAENSFSEFSAEGFSDTSSNEEAYSRWKAAIAQQFSAELEQYLLFWRNYIDGDKPLPVVFIAGRTGAGKSTLINAIMQKEVAPTGAGDPVPTDFKRYYDHRLPFALHDSPGFEGGKTNSQDYLKLVEGFLKRTPPDVIWYVLSASGGRITDFDISMINETFSAYPVCVVLSKSDVVQDDQIIAMQQAIVEAQMQLKGIFTVAANPLHSLDEELQARFSPQALVEKTQGLIAAKASSGWLNWMKSLRSRR